MSTAKTSSGAHLCALSHSRVTSTVTHHRGEVVGTSPLLSRFLPNGMVRRRMHFIIGDEEPGSRSHHSFSGSMPSRQHLATATLFDSNGGKSYLCFRHHGSTTDGLRRMSFSKIPRDTLYSISPALAGWYEWVAVVYISFQATILQEIL